MVFKTKRIKPNLTIGQRLLRAREQKEISLEQAEADTLIRAKYLRALESDNWRVLPGKVYFQGYLKRYSDYLDFDGMELVKQFSNELEQWAQPKLKQHRRLKFAITPKLIVATLISMVVLTMVGYIGFQVHKVTAPPSLVIVAPGDQVVWEKGELEIVGRTSAGAVVLINNQNVLQDDNGNFKQSISLQEGLNTIEIVAKSRFDKQTLKTIKVLKTVNSS